MTPEQIAAGRDQTREELAAQRQDRFFSAYMQKAKTALKIDVKQDVLAQVVGANANSPATPGCRCSKSAGSRTHERRRG